MQLLSVNIGVKRTQPKGSGLETTGIYKLPTADRVPVRALGVEADFVCNQKDHGGPDQAAYIYGVPDYDWWAQELGRDLAPGTFGENFTISGLESARLNVGDRLHLGSVILEVTAPRIPCSTLARRMGDPKFVKAFARAERPGPYCRVITEGEVQVGDAVELEPYRGESLSVLELFRVHYQRLKDEATLRRILRAPIAVRDRADIEHELQNLLAGARI